MQGIFSFNKPKGITSYKFIEQIKKATNEKKVGHAGTLDPMASGVLIVAIGKQYTKKISKYVEKEKEYEAVVKLGDESSTDDAEGEIKKVSDKEPTIENIEKVVKDFLGEIMQSPPSYSAIKIKGKRAYAYAREGVMISIPPRKVEIKNIEILEYQYPLLKIKVITGPGVYIRSLARDIGSALKTGGYLKELKRTRIGSSTIQDSIEYKDFNLDLSLKNAKQLL